MLNRGDLAPDFSLSDQDGKIHSLKQYLGKKVLLFFYPKDHTPGCTIEVKGIRDLFEELNHYGLIILGINADSTKKHQGFCTKHSLQFPLLSDPTKVTIEAYHAKGLLSIKRISYLIDEEGKILKAFPKISPNQHAEEILHTLRGK